MYAVLLSVELGVVSLSLSLSLSLYCTTVNLWSVQCATVSTVHVLVFNKYTEELF